MGASVYATFTVGIEVHPEDFWGTETTSSASPECPNGHAGPNGKFCSECGGRIEIQTKTRRVVTDNFAKYLGDDDPNGKARKAYDFEDNQLNPEYFEGLGFWAVDPYGCSEVAGVNVVLGLPLRESGNILENGYGKPLEPIPTNDILNAIARVKKVADALGLRREVKCYLHTYVSV